MHVRANNTVSEPSKIVLDKLLNFKKFIEHTLPESNVFISNLITRTDNGKASLTLFRMGFFEAAYGWGGLFAPPPPPQNPPHKFYNDETWHSYTLPREVPKNA